MHGASATQNWQASAFNELLKLVFSLPVRLHEQLAHTCPNFDKLLNSTEPSSVVLTDAKANIERILQLLPPDIETVLLEELITTFTERKAPSLKTIDIADSEASCNIAPSDSNTIESALTEVQKEQTDSSIDALESKPDLPPRRYSIPNLDPYPKILIESSGSKEHDDAGARAIDRLNTLMLGNADLVMEPTEQASMSKTSPVELLAASNGFPKPEDEPVYAEVELKQSTKPDRESKSHSSGIGTPLAQSTPFGTLSKLTSPKNQVNPKAARKRKKRKVSRWNFAAKFCSSSRSTTMSDSESMESAIYLQTTRPQVRIIKHHGRPVKGYKWLFKKSKH